MNRIAFSISQIERRLKPISWDGYKMGTKNKPLYKDMIQLYYYKLAERERERGITLDSHA
jgi:hypothetical protein